MGYSTPWTDEEDQILHAAWAEGMSDRQIAELLQDRTETAVRKRRQRISLASPLRTVDRARMMDLLGAGMSCAEVAVELGASERTIQQLSYIERRRAAPS